MNVSFSGCGFLGIYHVGVASAFKEYAPELMVSKISGASAGAIAACALICDCCLGQGTSDVLKVVIQARSTALGPMHPSFRLVKLLREGLRRMLPLDAHKRASGRLFISLTRFTDGENVLVSQFDTREELIQALICSAFIPFYCGTVPPSFKGVRYIDGGWSNNLPVLDSDTITVSPFAGESDICPADSESASFLSFDWQGTNVRFTSRNLYRFAVALFPPHPEEMSKMCRQGFEDALRYLAKNELVSCTRCLSVRSCITLPQDETASQKSKQPVDETNVPMSRRRPLPSLPKIRSSLDVREKAHHHPRRGSMVEGVYGAYSVTESECETCRETVVDAPAKGLPVIVRKTLEKAEETERGIINSIYNSYPVQWLRYLLIPWSYPLAWSCSVCERILEWLPSIPEDAKWLAVRLREVVMFVMKEIETNSHLYSARFSCQLAVTELNYTASGPTQRCAEKGCCSWADDWSHPAKPIKGESQRAEVDFGFSVDVSKSGDDNESGAEGIRGQVKTLKEMVRQDSVSRSDFPATEFVAAAESVELAGIKAWPKENTTDGDADCFANIVEYTKRHDALMAYYYLDENKRVNVFEIFGINEVNEETEKVREIFGRKISRRHSFVNTSDAIKRAEHPQDANLIARNSPALHASSETRDRASSLKTFKSSGYLNRESRSISFAVPSNFSASGSKTIAPEDISAAETRDACCSPIRSSSGKSLDLQKLMADEDEPTQNQAGPSDGQLDSDPPIFVSQKLAGSSHSINSGGSKSARKLSNSKDPGGLVDRAASPQPMLRRKRPNKENPHHNPNRLSAPIPLLTSPISSDSEGDQLFIPGRRRRAMPTHESSAYDAETSSDEDGSLIQL